MRSFRRRGFPPLTEGKTDGIVDDPGGWRRLVCGQRLGAAAMSNGLAVLAICVTIVLCYQGDREAMSMRQAVIVWLTQQGCR